MGANASGVNIFHGIPPLPSVETTGRVFFVGNSTTYVPGGVVGSDNAGANGDTPKKPFATIDYAIGQCTASRGDTIIVLPGHAETLATAGAITCDMAGVNIIGLGAGSNKPSLTFGTAVGASVVVSAANVKIKGIVGISGIDGLTNPFHIQAADCELDIEWRDSLSTVEAVRAILTTAAADRLKANLKYLGQTGGDACVNAIRLVGCNGANIYVDFYGLASTSIVEFVTTACTDIDITGIFHNSGTALSKNVVDTASGSTWSVQGFDSVAGYTFSGGSGSALSLDASERAISTAPAVLASPGPTTIFTVVGGPIEVSFLGSISTTINDATATTIKYSADPTTGAATDLSIASASLANAAAGTSLLVTGTFASAPTVTAAGTVAAGTTKFIVPAGVITYTTTVGASTGLWAHYLRYRPLARGVTVS